MSIDDEDGTQYSVAYLMNDEVIIRRKEYKQFRHALILCSFISSLGEPDNSDMRRKTTLQTLIEKSDIVMSME